MRVKLIFIAPFAIEVELAACVRVNIVIPSIDYDI